MKEIFKNYWYVVVIIACFISIHLIYNSSKNVETKLESEEIVKEVIKEEKVNEEYEEVINYFVDIKGEVVKPGVYEIERGERIIDVIKKAGGLTKNADTSLLNLSKKVTDEMNIKVYSKKEVIAARESILKEPEVIEIIKEIEKECVCPDINEICNNKNDAVIEEESDESDEKDDKLVNLNTAEKEELMTIPNIGESKANSIIEYRQKNKYEKIEDILNVSGIGESVFEKIKEYITV